MLTPSSRAYPRSLGDGLYLRWSTSADTEHIAQFAGTIFRSREDAPFNDRLAGEVHRLMQSGNPLMDEHDFALVEDTSKHGNPIVACSCLWHHNWEYEGIPFRVGRPEIVATDPAYRRRGLVRSLFEMLHARSESEGDQVQVITGIPNFYRQFGYEYALDLDGKRVTYVSLIPRLKDNEYEPYTLREAAIDDIPLIQEFYGLRRSDSIVWATVPDSYWAYQIQTWQTHSEKGWTNDVQMIVDATGIPKGYITLAGRRWGRDLIVWDLQTARGVNVQAMMPSVLRALQEYGLRILTTKPDTEVLSEISFHLGCSHPVYDALGSELAPFYEPPYAWYIRVRDIPGFLRLLTPALERRLEHSIVAGYSGTLKIDFYRAGLALRFEHGRLLAVENWQAPAYNNDAGAGFPSHVFLQLVFGHRSLADLRHAFPDVWAKNEAEVLLTALFPTRPSFVHPLSY